MDERYPAAALVPAWLTALALAGCGGDGRLPTPAEIDAAAPDELDGAARETRAAELFAPREPLSLAGTRWQAEALVLPGVGKLPLLSGVRYTLELDAGGDLARGTDGCDPYLRGYELDGAALRLTRPDGTANVGADGSAGDGADGAACELSELGAVERSIVGGLLAATVRFEIRGDRLFLNGADDSALVLRGRPLGDVPARDGPVLAPEFAAGERVPFATLERSTGQNLGAREVAVPERFVTAHDASSFASLWRNAHSFDDATPVPDVRFDVGGVVAVFSPLRPSLGFDIEIEAIVAGGDGPEDGPRVLVTTRVPGPGCLAADALSVPYEIVAVPMLMPSPRFEETVVEGEPCA